MYLAPSSTAPPIAEEPELWDDSPLTPLAPLAVIVSSEAKLSTCNLWFLQPFFGGTFGFKSLRQLDFSQLYQTWDIQF